MIYIVGDRHGEYDGFTDWKLPTQSTQTSEDTVIVTGDFGYVMHGENQNPNEKRMLDALAEKTYCILFCDGNHEGFDALETYPETTRFGAPVRMIRENICWLQRGYLYTIEEKTFFVMSGAYRIDRDFRMAYFKTCGEKILFEQELPTQAEYHRAIETLQMCNHCVDYIITHTAPRSIIPRVIRKYPDPHDAELTGFLDWIYHDVTFWKWFFQAFT